MIFNYFFAFGVAFIFSLLLTPLLKIVSSKFNVLDQPGTRKIHIKPIPLMGGIAIFIAFALAVWLSGTAVNHLVGILLVGLIFVAFGFLDDAGILAFFVWNFLLRVEVYSTASGKKLESSPGCATF